MSIYHLHIPRTSGGFIRKSILENFYGYSVTGHYRTIDNYEFEKADFISGHYGLNPCKYVDKVFAVLRSPNELTFSYIKYLALVSGQNNFDEEFLKRYLYDDKLRFAVTNVNTRFLSNDVNLDNYNANIENLMNMANNSWYLENEEVSVERAIDKVKENNIELFFYDSQNLYNSIFDFLNEEFLLMNSPRVNASFMDTDNLYQKYFDEINLANEVDLELYRRVLDANSG